jgi:hypothetical protein
MAASETRRPGILDAMILVAATGLGLALLRATLARSWFASFPKETRFAQIGIYTAVPILVVWTPTLLVLRLRHPRPRWRRLGSQPGMVGSSAATLVLCLGLLPLIPPDEWLLMSLPFDPRASFFYRGYPGYGVAGAWVILALCERWRAEASWLDRLGRAVGWGWIIVNLIAQGMLLLL